MMRMPGFRAAETLDRPAGHYASRRVGAMSSGPAGVTLQQAVGSPTLRGFPVNPQIPFLRRICERRCALPYLNCLLSEPHCDCDCSQQCNLPNMSEAEKYFCQQSCEAACADTCAQVHAAHCVAERERCIDDCYDSIIGPAPVGPHRPVRTALG